MFAIRTQSSLSLPASQPPEPGAPSRPSITEPPSVQVMMDRELDTAGSEPVRPKACGVNDDLQAAPHSEDVNEHGLTPAFGRDLLAAGSGSETRWRENASPRHIVPRPEDDIDHPTSPQEDAKMEEALGEGAPDVDGDLEATLEPENEKEVKGKEPQEVAAAQDIAVPLCSSLPDLSKAAADAIVLAAHRALSVDEARAVLKCRASLPISSVPPADAKRELGRRNFLLPFFFLFNSEPPQTPSLSVPGGTLFFYSGDSAKEVSRSTGQDQALHRKRFALMGDQDQVKAVLVHYLPEGATAGGDKSEGGGSPAPICSEGQVAGSPPQPPKLFASRPRSRFKGLTWDTKTNKWMVRVCCRNKRICIGHFADEKEAAKSYDREALRLK
jgi:hypothetical protein